MLKNGAGQSTVLDVSLLLFVPAFTTEGSVVCISLCLCLNVCPEWANQVWVIKSGRKHWGCTLRIYLSVKAEGQYL